MPVTFTNPPRFGTGSKLAQQALPKRMLLAAALLVAALLIPFLLLRGASSHSGPQTLSQYRLVGARGPVCLRMILAEDVSGSMTAYSSARSAALADIRTWSAKNLRRGDQVGVIDFAGNAVWQSQPTSVDALPGASSGQLDANGTSIMPVLGLVGALPQSSCDTALTFLSDGLMSDLPTTSKAGLTDLSREHIHDLFWLVPGRSIPISDTWTHAFPVAPPVRFNGLDPAATGLTFGRVISAVTRQKLQHI